MASLLNARGITIPFAATLDLLQLYGAPFATNYKFYASKDAEHLEFAEVAQS